jgi:hypothetical protein
VPRLLFGLAKGFIYGTVVGLFFATAIFMLASSVAGMGFLTVPPVMIASIIFAAGVLSGVSYEYGAWMDTQKPVSLLFRLSKGFIYGTTVGLFFATAIYLIALPIFALGFITITPIAIGGLIFAAGVLSGVAYEYDGWLEFQKTPQQTT